jgi:hypothetical protein
VPIGLTGEATGFQNEGTTGPLDLDTLDVEHGSSFHASATQCAEPAIGKTARRFSRSEKSDWRSCHGGFAIHSYRGDPMPPRGLFFRSQEREILRPAAPAGTRGRA